MKSKVIMLVLVIVLLLSQVGYSLWNIITGNQYLEQSETQKTIYFAGLFDMWSFMIYHNFSEYYQVVDEKTKDMTVPQIRRIFEKYLENNPERLHFSSASLFNSAMDELIRGQ
jgi:hypothetical protein